MSIEQAFDYTSWQQRLNFTNQQAAHALDVSESFYSQLKRKGSGRKVYAFAAYGIECADLRTKAAQA